MVQFRELSVVALILAFIASLGVNINNVVNDEGIIIDEGYIPYTCEREDIPDYLCYKLSKVGTTGVNRNCYYDRERGKKYKVCSTGWERIQVIDPGVCLEVVCEETKCPYVTPCAPEKECEVCKECSNSGGSSYSCPTCQSCNNDGTTECSETIGFMVIPDAGKYYCRNCGIGGCDECVLNDDIMMDFDMTLYESP